MQFNHILICYTLKNILQFIALLIMIDLENELPAWYHIKVVYGTYLLISIRLIWIIKSY